MKSCLRLALLAFLVAASSPACTTDSDEGNQAPVISVDVASEIEHVVGDVIKITVSAEDPEGDPITFRLRQGPERADFQEFEKWAVFDWDPLASDITENEPMSLIFAAKDDKGNESQQVVKVHIRPGNGIPVFTSDSSILHNASSDQPIAFDVTVRDDDSESVALRMDQGPAGAEFTRTGDFSARFGWEPSQDQFRRRVHSVVFVADDGQNDPVEQEVTVVLKKEQQKDDGDIGGGGDGEGDSECPFEDVVTHTPPQAQRTTDDIAIEASLADGAKYDGLVLNWTTKDPFNDFDLDWNSITMEGDAGDFSAVIPNPLLDSGDSVEIFYELCAVDNDAAEDDGDTLLCGPSSLYYGFVVYPPDNEECVDPTFNQSFENARDISTEAWNLFRSCPDEDNYLKLTLASGATADVYFTYPTADVEPAIEIFDADQNPEAPPEFSACSGYASVNFENNGSATVKYFKVAGGEYPFQTTAFVGAVDPADCADKDMEPNDTAGEATEITTESATYNGLEICTKDDVDIFSIDAEEGETINVTATFTHDVGDLDLLLFAPSQKGDVSPTGFSSDFGWSLDDNEEISHVAKETGTYYILVHSTDDPNTYDLSVSIEAAQMMTCTDMDAFMDNHSKADAKNLPFQKHEKLTVCPGAPDWYKFLVFEQETVRVELTVTEGNLSDVTMTAFDSTDNAVGTVKTENGMMVLEFTSFSVADHFLKIEAANGVKYELMLTSQF